MARPNRIAGTDESASLGPAEAADLLRRLRDLSLRLSLSHDHLVLQSDLIERKRGRRAGLSRKTIQAMRENANAQPDTQSLLQLRRLVEAIEQNTGAASHIGSAESVNTAAATPADVDGKPLSSRRPYSAEERMRLATMVTQLFDHWQLDGSTAAALLGLSENSRTAMAGYRKGKPLPDNRDLLDRVGNLFGIHKSLRLLYPHNRELVYAWPTARNQRLDNLTPVEIMVEQGLPGIVAMRGYLDFLRGH